MAEIRRILSAVEGYHRERAADGQISLRDEYSSPRYLNVIRENGEIPATLEKKAKRVSAHDTVAHTLAAQNSKDALIKKIKSMMPDEDFDTEEGLLKLIKFIYAALSGLCHRESGAIVESCRIFSRNNRQVAENIRAELKSSGTQKNVI